MEEAPEESLTTAKVSVCSEQNSLETRAVEVKMELFSHNRQSMFVERGAAFDERNALLTVKHGGGSVMLWGCVAASGTGNIAQVDGRMDSTKYQQILTQSVKKPKLKRGSLLQQDSEPNIPQNSPLTTSREAS